MQRRRFVFGAASAALAAPLAGLPGCGGGNSYEALPQPIPPSAVVLHLPADMYRHANAPTEWWWLTGTLKAGNRTFGLEINAASFIKDGYAFSQIMLSDVERDKHYQRSAPYGAGTFDIHTWAEADTTKPWYARLGQEGNQLSAIEVTDGGSGYTDNAICAIEGGGGEGALAVALHNPTTGKIIQIAILSAGSGYTSPPKVTIIGGGGAGATAQAYYSFVDMHAPAANLFQNLSVKARLVDDPSGKVVLFDLKCSQQGPPFIVFGTGVSPDGVVGPIDVTKNNYYFSLTRLVTTGSITIDGETLNVTGVTWMDHEYGAFGTAANPVKWILQDMQLTNGFSISNFATPDKTVVALNQKAAAHATVQAPDGTTYFVPSFVTPIGKTWTSPQSGKTYFLQFHVEIPGFNASLFVNSSIDSQEFPVEPSSGVYEGVCTCSGTFQFQSVTGTAWNEQAV